MAACSVRASDSHIAQYRCLHQRVHNGTGYLTLDVVTEQTVLSVYHKGPDRILRLASLFWVNCFQPCKILLPKGPNLILGLNFTSFDICIYVLLQGEQLRTVLESIRCLAGFHRGSIRNDLRPFPSGIGPAAVVGDLLHRRSRTRQPEKPLRKLSGRLPLRLGWYSKIRIRCLLYSPLA